MDNILSDSRLSFKAKGIYAYIQKMGGSPDLSVQAITDSSKENRGAVTSGIVELEALGYLIRTKYQDTNGYWKSKYEILDQPKTSVVLKKVVQTEKKVDEVAKLYYQYLKKYSIPVMNHIVLKKKINELRNLRGEEWCIKYLTFMINVYESVDVPYKPRITNSLDLFAKSATIEETMKKFKEDTRVY